MIIYFFVYLLSSFIVVNMAGTFSVQKVNEVKKKFFLYAKSQEKSSFLNIKNIDVLITEIGENFSLEEKNNILMEKSKIEFNFSELPKKCISIDVNWDEASSFLMKNSECSYDALTLNKSGRVENYFFSTFPSGMIYLKNVFNLGAYQFVLNLNDHIFYFDGPERELSFIGKGEIIFAVPLENIISITKRE